jgi:hypothetical protein
MREYASEATIRQIVVVPCPAYVIQSEAGIADKEPIERRYRKATANGHIIS